MKTFVIADTHFNHKRIIEYCHRPFSSVEEMNGVMIQNWNNTVSDEDTVFMLGDFGIGRGTYQNLVPQLHGKKILIKGNHDYYPNDFLRACGFKEVSDYPILIRRKFLLSHAPLMLDDNSPFFNYYGHVHDDENFTETKTSKCVSVEKINYTPFQIAENKN